MKRFLFIISVVVAAFATSCKNEQTEADAPKDDCFYFEARVSGSVICMKTYQNKSFFPGDIPSIGLEYTTDGKTWYPFVANETEVTLADKGDRVYIRAKGENDRFGEMKDKIDLWCYSFSGDGLVSVGGNIMYLLDGTGGQMDFDPSRNSCAFISLFGEMESLVDASQLILPAQTMTECCYAEMFNTCKSLRNAPELPATKLATECYHAMFYGCEMLGEAPELVATELAVDCYHMMFLACRSLKETPKIAATKLAAGCCYGMFCYCYGIEKASELRATEMCDSCYAAMFYRCSSLREAPELPSTTLARKCYEMMFFRCSSLERVPELPATTLAESCYDCMFIVCENMSGDAVLPATTLATGCYLGMFFECSSLNSIDVNFTNWGDSTATQEWVTDMGDPEGKVFKCPAALDTTIKDIHHVPEGWRIELK